MMELTEHERRGSIDGPFELTKQHERAQREAAKIWDAVHCDTSPLTWDAYTSGEPCPGCGLPYRDAQPWELKGTMYFSDEEGARYVAEEIRYKTVHGDCHAIRHSVEGSLTVHCGKCCPAPPLSVRQIERIGHILGAPTRPHELMRWRLRLYCGHVVGTDISLHAQDVARCVHTGDVMSRLRP